jgi:hypothetical protein
VEFPLLLSANFLVVTPLSPSNGSLTSTSSTTAISSGLNIEQDDGPVPLTL